jgi:RNA recognition motif-containing protein
MSIYVSNINWDTTSETLEKTFTKFGTVTNLLLKENKVRRSPAYAIIQFSSANSAPKAIKAALEPGINVDKRELRVVAAKPPRFTREKDRTQQKRLPSRAETKSTARPASPPPVAASKAPRAKSRGRAKSTPRGERNRGSETNALPSTTARTYAPNDVRNTANRGASGTTTSGQQQPARGGQAPGSPQRSARASGRAKSTSRGTRSNQTNQQGQQQQGQRQKGAKSTAQPASTPRSKSPAPATSAAARSRAKSTPRQQRQQRQQHQREQREVASGVTEMANRVSSHVSARADAAADRAQAMGNGGASAAEQRLEATQMMRTAALSGDRVSLKAAIAYAEASPIKQSLQEDLMMARVKLQKMG